MKIIILASTSPIKYQPLKQCIGDDPNYFIIKESGSNIGFPQPIGKESGEFEAQLRIDSIKDKIKDVPISVEEVIIIAIENYIYFANDHWRDEAVIVTSKGQKVITESVAVPLTLFQIGRQLQSIKKRDSPYGKITGSDFTLGKLIEKITGKPHNNWHEPNRKYLISQSLLSLFDNIKSTPS